MFATPPPYSSILLLTHATAQAYHRFIFNLHLGVLNHQVSLHRDKQSLPTVDTFILQNMDLRNQILLKLQASRRKKCDCGDKHDESSCGKFYWGIIHSDAAHFLQRERVVREASNTARRQFASRSHEVRVDVEDYVPGICDHQQRLGELLSQRNYEFLECVRKFLDCRCRGSFPLTDLDVAAFFNQQPWNMIVVNNRVINAQDSVQLQRAVSSEDLDCYLWTGQKDSDGQLKSEGIMVSGIIDATKEIALWDSNTGMNPSWKDLPVKPMQPEKHVIERVGNAERYQGLVKPLIKSTCHHKYKIPVGGGRLYSVHKDDLKKWVSSPRSQDGIG